MRRKYFIKDLFNPKTVLSNFHEIEFESFDIFVRMFNDGFISKKIDYVFPIDIDKDMVFLKKISRKSYFFDRLYLNIKIESNRLKEFFEHISGLEDCHFTIITDDKVDLSLDDLGSDKNSVKWLQKNRLFVETTINYQNYKTKLNDLLTIYNTNRIRFFYLNWNYYSFEQMPLKEMHEFEYRISHFMSWCNSTKDERKYDNQPIMINKSGFRKKLFIDNEMKMYLSKLAFKDGDILFDLKKHKHDDGISVSFVELNKLRNYIDLTPEFLIGTCPDISYVDYYQNKKVMGNINEIPIISEKVGEIIYGI